MKTKEIKLEEIFNDEKREGVKQAILEHKAEEWMPWDLYLIWLGERSVDYSYTKEMIFEHIEYFKRGWLSHSNPYYLLEMFSFELSEKL